MITLVVTYYDNPRMLARQIEEWRKYDPSTTDVIVVDDCSLQSDAAEAITAAGGAGALQEAGRLQVYRVQVHIPWNQDGCRNLAMRECRTQRAFMTDIDHVVPAEQMRRAVGMDHLSGHYYMPDQQLTSGISLGRPHPNSYLFDRDDYWSIGGYDEDYCGYYGSDGNFRARARGLGLCETYTNQFFTVVYRTQDIYDANTKNLGRKGTAYHVKSCKRLQKKLGIAPYVAADPVRFPWERVI